MQGGHLVVIVLIQRILEILFLREREFSLRETMLLGERRINFLIHIMAPGKMSAAYSLFYIFYLIFSLLGKSFSAVWCHYSVGSSAADNWLRLWVVFFFFLLLAYPGSLWGSSSLTSGSYRAVCSESRVHGTGLPGNSLRVCSPW